MKYISFHLEKLEKYQLSLKQKERNNKEHKSIKLKIKIIIHKIKNWFFVSEPMDLVITHFMTLNAFINKQ